MWLIDFPLIHSVHDFSNKLLCFRYYGNLNLNCLTQNEALIADVDDYYSISDDKKQEVCMKQSSQKPKQKSKSKLKSKIELESKSKIELESKSNPKQKIPAICGFDNKAFQYDIDVGINCPSPTKFIESSNQSSLNYYKLWQSKSSNSLKNVQIGHSSPPPLPPRAIKQLMHERRLSQQFSPPLIPRQHKPKNLYVPSENNENDKGKQVGSNDDNLFNFNVTDIDDFDLNSFLNVRLLGISHSDSSLSDCVDLCKKSSNQLSARKVRSKTISCDNYVTNIFADRYIESNRNAINKNPQNSESSKIIDCSKKPILTTTGYTLNNSIINKSKLPNCSVIPSLSGNTTDIQLNIENYELLPPNWEARMDSRGRIFYIDHINKTTSWFLPDQNSKENSPKNNEENHRKQLERRYESIKQIINENEMQETTKLMTNPHPALKFLCRPDFYYILHLNQNASNIYKNNTAVKKFVNNIRKNVDTFEKYQHYREFVIFMNCFSDSKLELLPDWELKVDEQNNTYFIDHINHKTTYIDPRLPNDFNIFGYSITAPSVAPRPFLPSNSSISRKSSDISTIQKNRLSHPYNEQIVAFLRQLNILDILKERYSAVSNSAQLRDKINSIRVEGKVALDRFSDDLQLALVLSLFEEEIMSYVPYPPPQLSVETTQFLINDCNKIENQSLGPFRKRFEIKLRNFYRKLDSKGYGKGPLKLRLNLRRENVLEDTFRIIMSATKKELQKGSLYVSWDKEESLDQGGPSRELFFLLSRELFNPYYGLFEYSANGVYTVQISPMSTFVDNYRDWFRFCGRILGLALVNKYLLDVYFIRPIYKKLLKLPISLIDLESVDPEFYQSLLWIKDNNISNLASPLDLSFVVTEEIFGQILERELKPGGRNSPVTEKNKMEYLERMTKWRLERGISEQLDWLVQGFYEVIDLRLISMFDAKELELLLAGTIELNVTDWQQHTEYYGYKSDDQVIKWFWQAIDKFTNEQRLRLLQFVTGTSSIPYEGFGALRGSNGIRRFYISKYGTKNMLPRAQTCFNRLELPPYPSFEILYNKLLLAVEETNTFGLQ